MKLIRFYTDQGTIECIKPKGMISRTKLDGALKGLNVKYEVVEYNGGLGEGTTDEIVRYIESAYRFNNHHKVG